jgi:UPF0271 protein
VPTIDVNCDCGESFGNWTLGIDTQIIPLVTTVNVACGFHAGDPVTMIQTIEAAQAAKVRIGAHPGLPDLLGFGRRAMDLSAGDAYAYIAYQVGALASLLRSRNLSLSHVKPHGALYAIRSDRELAAAAAQAIADTMSRPVLYWPVGEGNLLAEELSARGGRVVNEFYPDLGYASDGSTVVERRKRPVSAAEVATRVRRFLEEGQVQTVDGNRIDLRAESICVHGDTPNALEVVGAVHQAIEEAGWECGPLDARDRTPPP